MSSFVLGRSLRARCVAQDTAQLDVTAGRSAARLRRAAAVVAGHRGIGIHALFGAFLLGAIIPHDSQLARELTDKLDDFVVVLFLPAFFAFTGMRTQIGLVERRRASG